MESFTSCSTNDSTALRRGCRFDKSCSINFTIIIDMLTSRRSLINTATQGYTWTKEINRRCKSR